MKISEVLRLLAEDGWFLVATRGFIGSPSIQAKPGASPSREIRVTTRLPAPWAVLSNRPV